jgi:hypothetical protein
MNLRSRWQDVREEWRVVLAHSLKTQWWLVLMVALPAITLLIGRLGLDQVRFHAPLAPLERPVRDLIGLLSYLGAAYVFVRCALHALEEYRRTRGRLYTGSGHG